MAKFLNFRVPSGQSIILKTAEENDDAQVMTALENEFNRLKADKEQALAAQANEHRAAVASLEKEIETLKSKIASRIVLQRKQSTSNPKFDERREMEYYMGLPADRLIEEAQHTELETNAPLRRSLNGPVNGEGIFSGGAGVVLE